MKTSTAQKLRVLPYVLLCSILFLMASPTMAQQAYKAQNIKSTVDGTSTLHDWQMLSNKGEAQASFTWNGNELKGIQALTFSLQAESLKSSKSGLDKNAYKALLTNKHKNISYSMKSGTVTKKGSAYTISSNGSLQIAGQSYPLKLTANASVDKSGNITVVGTTQFAMSSYGIKPPTVMMGTIKTGDAVTISFNAVFTK